MSREDMALFYWRGRFGAMANDHSQSEAPGSRRAVRYAVIAAGILALAYCGAWFATAALLRGQAKQWMAAQQANGLEVHYTGLKTGGFPAAVRLTMTDVMVTMPRTHGGWTWHTGRLRLEAWPLRLWRLTVDLSGRHGLSGAITPSRIPIWIDAGRAHLDLHIALTGRLRTATLAGQDVKVRILDGSPALSVDHGHATLTLLDATPAATGAAPGVPITSRLSLDAAGVALPTALPAPLSHPIRRAAATLEITGPVAAGPLPLVLEAWRVGGGTLEVRDALVDWPPLTIAASGTVALDDDLQPEGAFSLRFQGGGETLDALAAGGWMKDEEAGVAKLGLALMGRPGADGKTSELTVPMSLQNRRLSTGPVPIMTVPEIQWTDAIVP